MTSMAEVVSDEANELSCVLIPAAGDCLLLPNVCVAEIIPWRRIKEPQGGPAWFMGVVGWRGQTLTVVNYPGFGDAPMKPNNPRCLVIMNRTRNSSGPAFYAIAAEGLPRMLQLMPEDLGTDNSPLGPADALRVNVGTDTAVIPDLGYVEDSIRELSIKG